MSKLVCQMRKVKQNDVRGYQIHNLRELKSKTNPDIDPSLEHLNKDFANNERINFMKKWKETYESQNTSGRTLRKNAVFYNEFIIGSDRDFFDKLDQSEKDRFFKTATDFFKERYGEQNVLYSIAHYDETRGAGAHAHVAIVPMRDGKLQSKNVFDRNELRFLQDELPKTLQRAGFDIDRGREGSKAQHIDMARLKLMKAEEAERAMNQDVEFMKQHVELLNEQIEVKTAALEKIEEIESVEYQEKRTWYGKTTDQIVVDHEDFEQIKKLADDHAKLKADLAVANQKNQVLRKEYDDLEKVKDRYADQNHKLGLELHNHKTDVERIVKLETKREREALMAEAKGLVEKATEIAKKNIDKSRQEVRSMEFKVKDADERVDHVYAVLDDKNKEIETKDQQIRKLSDELELLKQSFDKYKSQVKEQIEKAIKETTKFVKKAVMKANHEWIKTNTDAKVTVDHSFADKEIEQRSDEIKIELEEKNRQRQIDRDQDRGMGR